MNGWCSTLLSRSGTLIQSLWEMLSVVMGNRFSRYGNVPLLLWEHPPMRTWMRLTK